MSAGTSIETNFARATRILLEYMSSTAGLCTWTLCRTDLSSSYTLAVCDPLGAVHAHEALPAPISRSSDHWVSAPVHLADGTLFGELVGFDPSDRSASIPELRPTLQVHAMLLGALASAELAVVAERRAGEILNGQADPLTGLGTRQGWEQRARLDELFCREFGERAWVLVVELTELKRYNELHGHSAGDDQLRIAGTAVREVLGARHYGARITGDRFAALLIGVDEQEAHRIAHGMHEALAAVGAVGTAVATGLGRRRPETGLGGALAAAEADIDRNHHPELGGAAASSEVAALVDALETGAIKAYFQPIVNLHTGEVVAIEALARWHSPDGIREPEAFLPALRHAGLLNALFDRMLDDGLSALSDFRHVAPRLQLAVSLHLDARTETNVLTSISERLVKHGLQPACLTVQFSETQGLDALTQLSDQLHRIAALGVHLVLQDFGSGFASLDTLSSMPITGVKLNRRFSTQVVGGDQASSVVRAMVNVATTTGLTVVAEGIETEVQRESLVNIGCALGQGYLFALPQPADSLSAFLSAPLANVV